MGDYGSLLRQFGHDVSSAIVAGPQAELLKAKTMSELGTQRARNLRQQAAFEQDQGIKRATEKRASDKQGHLEAAANTFSDPQERELMLSGQGSMISKLREDKKPPKTKEPTDYQQDFDFGSRYAERANQEVGKMFSDIAQKQAKGEDTSEDMSAAIVKRDAIKKTLDEFVIGFQDSKAKRYGVVLSQAKDQVLANMDQARLDLTSDALSRSLEDMGSDVKRYSNVLDSASHKYPVNTKGIPSTKDIYGFLMAGQAKKTIPKDVADALLDVRDPKKLRAIIEDDASPEDLRVASTMLLRNVMASNLVQAGLRKARTTPDSEIVPKTREYVGRNQ